MSSAAATIDSKKPLTKQELITANIKLLIEQLEAGKSEVLTHYLTAMSRFNTYSFGNVLEIARQMPTATRGASLPRLARMSSTSTGTANCPTRIIPMPNRPVQVPGLPSSSTARM